MKIQSPAILAIGLVVSLASAFAGLLSPTGTAAVADKALLRVPPIVESRRPAATDVERQASTHTHFTEVERLALDH